MKKKFIFVCVLLSILLMSACGKESVKELTTVNVGEIQNDTNAITQGINNTEVENKEVLTSNVEKLLPIFRGVSGFLITNETYDTQDNLKYWKILNYAVNEYEQYIVDKTEVITSDKGSTYIISPDVVSELAYVLFPEKPDFKNVTIPNEIKYVSYIEKENVYHFGIGELGTFRVTIQNIELNKDNSLSVTVLGKGVHPDGHKYLYNYTLIKNEKAETSKFSYSIKNVTWSEID